MERSVKPNPAIACEDIEARHRELRPSTVLVNGKPALCSSLPLVAAMVNALLAVDRG